MLDSILLAFGLKKLTLVAGLVGGALSAAVVPGPLSSLTSLVARIGAGAACGAIIAGYGAQPLAEAFMRTEYVGGIGFGLGIVGLTFVFKVLGGINSTDFGAIINSWLKKGNK